MIKHRRGRAGTWLEVKTIKGLRYMYERTRVYLGGGKTRLTSKYLGPVKDPRNPTLKFVSDDDRVEVGQCLSCGRIFRLSTATKDRAVMKSVKLRRELLAHMFDHHDCAGPGDPNRSASGWQWTLFAGTCVACEAYVPQLARCDRCGTAWLCDECAEEHECG